MKLKKNAGKFLDKYSSSELAQIQALIVWELSRRERNRKRLGVVEDADIDTKKGGA